MHDPSDLEAAIGQSFESRSAHLSPSDGDLYDVLVRVERRRSRRRSVAAVGSLAAIGVGVIGVVALADREDAGPVASDGSEAAAATVDQVATQAAWRCEDQFAYWGEAGEDVYFASCEQVTIDSDIDVLDPPAPTTPAEQTTTTTIVMPSEVIGTSPSIPVTTIPPGDRPISPVEQVYTVVAGDAVAMIAQKFGVGMESLVAYNEWPEGVSHPIFVGDEIRIPPGALVPIGPGIEPRATTSTTAG